MVLAWNSTLSEGCSRLARDVSAGHENDRIMHQLHNVGRLFIVRRRWHLMRDLYSVKLPLEIHEPGAAAEYNSVPFGFFDGLILTSSLARVYCYFRTETWDN
jgi:hypothetical protein